MKDLSKIDRINKEIEEFFKALNESIAKCDSIPRNEPHAELNSAIGGGA